MKRVLIGVALAASLAAQCARADMPAGGVDVFNNTATTFVALLKDKSVEQPPRIADARAKPLLEALTDRQAVIGAGPYKAADIPPLLSVFSGYFALTKIYMEHRDAAGKQSPGDNEFAYQDELAPLAARMLDTGGALSQALTDAAAEAGLPAQRKAELGKLRMGVSQMFSSIITLLQNPRYSEANKVLLARGLAENAMAFRDTVSVAERGNIVNAAMQSMLQTPKAVEDDMNAFVNAMKSEECTGLCALE